MYWRIKKIEPEQLIRQYGIHVALVISVLVNIYLFASRPRASAITAAAKTNFEQFARNVTNHLLDTSYISYESSTAALTDPQNPELAPSVVAMLRQNEMLARNQEEFNAQARSLKEERRVSAVRIDEVKTGDPGNSPLIPIEVKGVVAIHSATDSGPSLPVPFRFLFYMGNNKITHAPIVAEFRDLSPKPN